MAFERTWFQIGTRELLAAAFIVALGAMLYAERRAHKQVRARYEKLVAVTRLSIIQFPKLQRERTTGAAYEIDVVLHHTREHVFQHAPSISVRLVNPSSLGTVFDSMRREMSPCPEGHRLTLTPRSWPRTAPLPGGYLLVAEAYDGTTLIGKDATQIEFASLDVQAWTQPASNKLPAKLSQSGSQSLTPSAPSTSP